MTVPSGHEQNFLAEGIPKYVVDIGGAIDFKETKVAGVRSVRQTSVKQKTQFGELLRRVFSEVFNHLRWVLQVSHLPYLIPASSTSPSAANSFFDKHP